jgi:hypothetical protein
MAMDNSKTPCFLLHQITLFRGKMPSQFNYHYSNDAKEHYEPKFQELVKLKRTIIEENWDFIQTNWNEIKEILKTFCMDKYAQQKLRQKISQSKYYFKKKDALGKVKKPTLTPEEKAEKYKEQIKKANSRYYEKKRTELIELGVMKEKQTEEERKQLKKERNSIYYRNKVEQQKELKEINT